MLPLANAEEASLVTGVHVVPATSLKEAVAVISGEQPPPPYRGAEDSKEKMNRKRILKMSKARKAQKSSGSYRCRRT